MPNTDAAQIPATPLSGAVTGGRGFIVGPAYDLLFFILSPLYALILVKRVTALGLFRTAAFGMNVPIASFFISTWTYAHLFAAFWDIYHTSMQNFGFARLYDMKAGNDPGVGRALDIWLNHLLYIGPIFIGLSMAPNVDPLLQFNKLGWALPARIFAGLMALQGPIAAVVVAGGGGFIAIYVLVLRRRLRTGYRFSWQKAALLLSSHFWFDGFIWSLRKREVALT